MQTVLIKDEWIVKRIIRDRKRQGVDRYDEAWEGVLVFRPYPTEEHLALVERLRGVLHEVRAESSVFAPVNVSDRGRKGWKRNYLVLHLAVGFPPPRVKDCGTHFRGGPDFVLEIDYPDSETTERQQFLSRLGVREVLVIHRDTRTLKLLRHDGTSLVPVSPILVRGKKWVESAVVPLAFCRALPGGARKTEVRRTDGQSDRWTI